MRPFITALVMIAALILGQAGKASAAWPEKSITLIIPYAAGGVADATGRLVARELEKRLGVNIIAKNVVGATGSMGAAELAKAKPDGYTLGWFPPGPVVGMPNMRHLPYGKDDLVPVALLFDENFLLATSKKMPWADVRAMIDDVRQHPDAYVMGSPGRGGAVHLAVYSAIKGLGLQCRYVPERSNADVLKAIAGGTTHFHAASANEVQRFDLKPLLVLADHRSTAYPDVPTAGELGYAIPVFSNYMGLYAPKGISPEIVTRLSDTMGEIAASAEFQKMADQMGCTVRYMPHAEFLAFYDQQYALYKKLMAEVLKGS